MTTELWTLDELAAQASQAVSTAGVGQASGRVTDVPPPRTIRFYTTLGLLDPATELRGRTAYYGRRHLLQLVAIKRLQSRGESLAQVQQRLNGISGPELARLAQLPEAAEPGRARRKDFWKELPPNTPASAGPTLASVPVDGLMLVFPAARALVEDDLAALKAAAAPLLAVLRKRHLFPTEGDDR